MKIFIPRHIQGGFFNMNLSLGPININLIQLFILAGGMALALGLWNGISKATDNKVLATILASPLMILFVIIAFFKYSELTLLPFIAKLIRTYFLDVTRKFQVNYSKVDKNEVYIKLMKSGEKKQLVETKEKTFDQDKLKSLDQFLD